MATRGWKTRLLAVVSAGALLGGLAACSADAPAQPKEDNKSLVVFMPASAASNYAKIAYEAMVEEAKKAGYTITLFENNFDQAQEDQQVRQFVASKVVPSAILWWPSKAGSALNSVRSLAKVAPVVQFNVSVLPEQAEYVTSYVGYDHGQIGEIAGAQALDARNASLAAGNTLRGAGNILQFNFGAGLTEADERIAGFAKASKSKPFTVLTNEPSGINADSAYKSAVQLVPKYAADGIDFVYAMNYQIGLGVAKALQENGLTPGKDVFIIGGNLSGDLSSLKDGTIFSGAVQSARMTGLASVRVAVQYAKHGKVTAGSMMFELGEEDPGLIDEAPHESNIIPAVGVTGKDVDQMKIWGMDVATLTK